MRETIRISEAEAAGDFAAVLARVRTGVEVVIERDAQPVAVIRAAEPHLRQISESQRLARERHFVATLDGEFGHDLEEVINSHREGLRPPEWE